jgi:hypothetical protein
MNETKNIGLSLEILTNDARYEYYFSIATMDMTFVEGRRKKQQRETTLPAENAVTSRPAAASTFLHPPLLPSSFPFDRIVSTTTPITQALAKKHHAGSSYHTCKSIPPYTYIGLRFQYRSTTQHLPLLQ